MSNALRSWLVAIVVVVVSISAGAIGCSGDDTAGRVDAGAPPRDAGPGVFDAGERDDASVEVDAGPMPPRDAAGTDSPPTEGIPCGTETCRGGLRCCATTAHCYDPATTGCAGVGCVSPDGMPCCPTGYERCEATDSCYNPACTTCCWPAISCTSHADCPSDQRCCYSSGRCIDPRYVECTGPLPTCDATHACPDELVCCERYGLCHEPACTDCCPTDCAPDGVSCTASPGGCCGGLMCCSGAPLPPGVTYCSSTLCPVSDRAQKRDIEPIDPDQVLERVRAMPISTWSYIDMDDGARHIGPMAQDFSAAFNVGASDRCIATVDANGVALAAIQALARQVDELREDNHALRSEMVRLRRADRRARGRLRPR